jgi:hypothetical protein
MLATPLVASCIASNQTGPYRPVSIAEDVESIRRIAYPNDFTDFNSFSLAKQARIRNQIVTARMYIADLEYHYYEARLTREVQEEGLVATAVSLGLTGTATLIPVAQTTRLLSGIATGVTGLDKAYNEKELLSNTIQALQTQMRFDRKARAADIQAKMVKTDKVTATSIIEYPLAMALSDAEAYYQAGTMASALIGLPKTLANAETNAAQAKADTGPNAPAVSQAAATAHQVAPSTTVGIVRRVAAGAIITDVTRPLPEFQRPKSVNTQLTAAEQGLRVAALQTKCGLRSTGILDQATRSTLATYLNNLRPNRRNRTALTLDKFDQRDGDDLNALLDDTPPRSCS